jgi:hypothetical protein
MIFFVAFILPVQSENATRESGNGQSPDTTFFYTPDDLYRMAKEYGSNGRMAYIRSRWTFDLVFPLVYTAFLASGISWFNQRLTGWAKGWKLTNLLPLLGGIFDLLENSATTIVMSIFPVRSQLLLVIASLISPIKWVLVSSSFIPYFVLGAGWFIQLLKSKENKFI